MGNFRAKKEKHKLTLFLKMTNNLSPPYPSSLAHQTINHVSNYNLCNYQNLNYIATRTNLYYNSFFPSVIRDWNDLPIATQQTQHGKHF